MKYQISYIWTLIGSLWTISGGSYSQNSRYNIPPLRHNQFSNPVKRFHMALAAIMSTSGPRAQDNWVVWLDSPMFVYNTTCAVVLGLRNTYTMFGPGLNAMLPVDRVVKIQINVLFCPHVYWSSVYVTSSPPPCLYPAHSHPSSRINPPQSNIGPLCANTNMEMIDSTPCKWTLYGFCWLMGLEPC